MCPGGVSASEPDHRSEPGSRKGGTLTQIAVNGLLLGGIYALAGVGFALVWGVMNIINIAHGAFVMLGAYIAYWVFVSTGLDPFLAVPLSMLMLFVFGFLVQRHVINYVIRAPVFMTLILTLGLDMIIVNLTRLAFTADVRTVRTDYIGLSLAIGEVRVPVVRLAVFAAAALIAAALSLFLRRARLGQAIQAARMDSDSALLCGVNIGRVYAVTFGISAALAGAAGSLVSTVSAISPEMGLPFLAKSFAVTVLGGMGSVLGAIGGGVLLGLIESLTASTLGGGYRDMVGYIVLVLVLVMKPTGMFGKMGFD